MPIYEWQINPSPMEPREKTPLASLPQALIMNLCNNGAAYKLEKALLFLAIFSHVLKLILAIDFCLIGAAAII